MVECKVTINNETGIHARPADLLVKQCMKFKSKVEIATEDKVVNAKSILNLLVLGLKKGSEITLKVDGEDEEIAIKSIAEFIENLTD